MVRVGFLLALVSLVGCDPSTAHLLTDAAASSPPQEPQRIVGGSCSGGTDCAQGSLCLINEEFPGGSCALPCQRTTVCPADTACVEIGEESELPVRSACLRTCSTAAQCRELYDCRSMPGVGESSDVRVCIAD